MELLGWSLNYVEGADCQQAIRALVVLSEVIVVDYLITDMDAFHNIFETRPFCLSSKNPLLYTTPVMIPMCKTRLSDVLLCAFTLVLIPLHPAINRVYSDQSGEAR